MNDGLLPESMATHAIPTVYLGSAVLASSVLAWLRITDPKALRNIIDRAVEAGGLPRPRLVGLTLALFSVLLPASLLAVMILTGRRR